MTHSATLPYPSQHPAQYPAEPLAVRPSLTYAGGLPRLLPSYGAVPVDLETHLRSHGRLPYRGRPELITGDVEAAGLTGRGGAAFPTYRKLAAVAGYGRTPVVVGNGAEGEPASNKDKSLLWISPHLVLDGLQLAAEAVGSRTVGLYVHRNPRLHQHLAAAIAQRAHAGIDAARVELIEAPPRFLAGEESALASVTSGGPALPRFKPPRASQRGVADRPTLVQNVETLAHLALIGRYGAAWFRSVGTADEPGSMLTTLHYADGSRNVVEVPLGIPITDLLRLDGQVQAVLAGGYHGTWLPAAQAAQLPLANAALRPLGAAVGAGVLAALPAGRCGVAETARVVRYLALESAGQCGPCFNGLPRMATALGSLAGPRPDPQARADLERWSGLVVGRGACHHPEGTVRLIRSALQVFAGEIDRHARGQCTGSSRQPFLPLPAEPALDEADWR
ncbi:MAG TPA: NADH-quinone oxidoreductase subunit E [Actinobacteria bacterium]|nr:NADH-quinone oxidoreductase subunit E [Actinomycetota bacterium]